MAWKCGLCACACTSRLEYYSARAHPPGDRICRPRVCAGCVCVLCMCAGCVCVCLNRCRDGIACTGRLAFARFANARAVHILYIIILYALVYTRITLYTYTVIYIYTDVETHII